MVFPLLVTILLVVFLVSLISLIGIVTLSMKAKRIELLLFVSVSFAAGSLLGAAFLDLIPESLEALPSHMVFSSVLLGILVSFAVEKFLYHYHCHVGHKCDHPTRIKPYAFLNLAGDAIHNFLDGIIIAASFLTSFEVGIASSIAVIAHEIPQEIGDFAVLLNGGFTRKKALGYNFLSALGAVAGALMGYYFGSSIDGSAAVLAAFSGGTFIYIAASDLIPELHHEEKAGRSTLQFLLLLAGVLSIGAIGFFFKT